MLLLFTFYLNSGLHEVSMGKPSERMSNFWMVWFLKNRIRTDFGFPHIPNNKHTAEVQCHRVKSLLCSWGLVMTSHV